MFMADEADRGNETAELFLTLARNAVPAVTAPIGVGICINCGVDVEGEARWCDSECMSDYMQHGHK